MFLTIILLAMLFPGCQNEDFENIPIEGVTSQYAGLRVLWLGTSIPQGCSYPFFSCWKLGLSCTNHSRGESVLCFHGRGEKSLTATISEIDSAYIDCVRTGSMTWNEFVWLKNCSYERLVMPYLQDIDVVVIDHGYNDEEGIKRMLEDTDPQSIDRTNFLGAFNYLCGKIKASNPRVKIIAGGYFQNSCTVSYSARGMLVAEALESISRLHHVPLLRVWNEINLPDGYVPDSENYLDSLNAKYGTSYEKWHPNRLGEITYYQQFCPDAVHPFSDPTGHSERMLNIGVTKQLYMALSEAYSE